MSFGLIGVTEFYQDIYGASPKFERLRKHYHAEGRPAASIDGITPAPATIKRIEAAEEQRELARREALASRTELLDGVAELHTLARQLVSRTIVFERKGIARHITKPTRRGKLPSPTSYPDFQRLRGTAGVIFAAHPATIHVLGPLYEFDAIVASRPVSGISDDAAPDYPCDFRGPNCGPHGISRSVRYVAATRGQWVVLFGVCWSCNNTLAELARPRRAELR